ncbi:MAG: lycopene cyclase domain-containing protein [Dehalococcoidia bacterium]|nr:lycopene cyclase domain-containing protein [Dehalococcoidia bacterium]
MTRIGERLRGWTYVVFIVVWALPILVFQWALAGPDFLKKKRLMVASVLAPTAYLVASDGIAMREGIWTINPERVTGIYVKNVPLEEILFFLVTNMFVVNTVVMVNGPVAQRRVYGFLDRLFGRTRRDSGAVVSR